MIATRAAVWNRIGLHVTPVILVRLRLALMVLWPILTAVMAITIVNMAGARTVTVRLA